MKTNTETEEATNMEANTEVIGGLGLQQEKRERKGGVAAETKETTNMEAEKEAIGEVGLQQHVDKRGATAVHTKDNEWDSWDEYDVGDENTVDDEELIKQRSV